MKEKSRTSLSDAKTFIEELFYPLDRDERIEIRFKYPRHGQSMRQKFKDSTESAYRFAEFVGIRSDVYVGVAPRKGDVGTKEGVSRINALWADIDEHKNGEDIFSRVMNLECYPSTVVHSGGGLHTYWGLERPARTESELRRAENVMKSLAKIVGGDPVHDRSRILRVPLTLNHKYDPPRMVRLLFTDRSVRYSLEELEQFVRESGDQSVPTYSPSTRAVESDVLREEIGEGNRNVALTSIAGSLRSRGSGVELINDVLLAVNERRCSPPLPEEEIARIAESVSKYDAGTLKYRDSSARRVFGKGGSR